MLVACLYSVSWTNRSPSCLRVGGTSAHAESHFVHIHAFGMSIFCFAKWLCYAQRILTSFGHKESSHVTHGSILVRYRAMRFGVQQGQPPMLRMGPSLLRFVRYVLRTYISMLRMSMSRLRVTASSLRSDRRLLRNPLRCTPRVGLEPTTPRLTAECSTIELSRNIKHFEPRWSDVNPRAGHPTYTLSRCASSAS